MISYSAYLPTAHLADLQPLLDYAFLEPCTDPEYIDFYRGYPELKILDNGYIEQGNNPLMLDDLLFYAEQVKADIVIAPDKLGNWDYNLKNATALADKLGPERTALVLGGRTPEALSVQYYHGSEICDTLCIPYTLNRSIIERADSEPNRLHLLGLRIPEDFSVYSDLETVSLDSVEPISAAWAGWEYKTQGFGSFPRPPTPEYSKLKLVRSELDRAKSNIEWLKHLLHANASLWRNPKHGSYSI